MPFEMCPTAPAHVTELPLINRLQNADPTAMEELYTSYSRLAHRVIIDVVRDGGVAEDLVQETFLSVWRRAHLFDPQRGTFGNWFLTVARNRALDYLRSSRKLRTTSNYIDAIGDREDPRLLVGIERLITSSLARKPLQLAILKLGDMQRAVVELIYFEGCTHAEISTKLGRPVGTIKTWHRMALRKLKSQLPRGFSHQCKL